MITIQQLLIGKKVRATEDCVGSFKGQVCRIEKYGDILQLKGSDCTCVGAWELLDELHYKPEPHKHSFACSECGEKKTKPNAKINTEREGTHRHHVIWRLSKTEGTVQQMSSGGRT